VAENNKIEEIDEKQSSTSATLSSPSRTRDKSEELLWKWNADTLPGSIEPCTNAAVATLTNHEASKMARTGTDQQEVVREIFKRQNMKQTKAPTMMPKTKEDQVKWIQLMRRPDETKFSVDDRYNEYTTMIEIKNHLYDVDSVTVKPLRQSQKYERASVEIKPHINRAFFQDTFHYLTITHSLPPDISISQLQSATKEDNTDDIQENTANADHDQESNPTVDENDTHPRIAVGENFKTEVNIIKRMVEECYIMEDLAENAEHDDQPPVRPLKEIVKVNNTKKEDPHNADPGPGMVDDQEGLDHAAPGQEPENCHQEDRVPYVYEPNEKTDLGDILDQDQQNTQRWITTADSTHLQEATQQTVAMDAKMELTHYVAEYNTMHMDNKYETHLEEEESVDAYMDNANSTHQQDVTDDAQHQLMHGQSIPRAFFINKALPEVYIIQRGDAISLIDTTLFLIYLS
jgi:hypothetical protein